MHKNILLKTFSRKTTCFPVFGFVPENALNTFSGVWLRWRIWCS